MTDLDPAVERPLLFDGSESAVTSPADEAKTLASLLRAQRFGFSDEDSLQAAIAAALAFEGWDYQREFVLDATNRLDFLVDRVAIEVKIAGTVRQLIDQIERYSLDDRVAGVVVVTTVTGHMAMPGLTTNGTPVEVVYLSTTNGRAVPATKVPTVPDTKHGSIRRKGDYWAVYAKPHIMTRVRRLFPRVQQGRADGGAALIPASEEAARDLEMLRFRYELDMNDDDAALLTMEAQSHRERSEVVASILNGDRPEVETIRVMAFPARWPCQDRNADLISTVHGTLIGDKLGRGKAQPLDSLVLTPSGFEKMGSIEVGSAVIGVDGHPSVVTAVHPQGVLDCYEVEFSDGAVVRCSEDHLWVVRRSSRRDSRWQALTLRELIDNGLRNSSGQAKWHIPLMDAPDLSSRTALPIDPYVLGVLLGDGCLRCGAVIFTTADPEIADRVGAALPDGVTVERVPSSPYDYRITARRVARRCSCGRVSVARGLCSLCYRRTPTADLPPKLGNQTNPVKDALMALGLWGHLALDKFVPDIYKNAGAADRLALLQGLMDTDGWAASARTGIFYSSSERLAEDVRWVVESLGGVGRKSAKFYKGRDRYAIRVRLPRPLDAFRLARKAEVWGADAPTLEPTRAIVDVRWAGRSEMQCISVEGLPLYVTDHFVVTHNTYSGLTALRNPDALPAVVVCPPHIAPQWERETRRFWPDLTVHVAQKVKPYPMAVQPDVLIVPYSKIAGWADTVAGEARTVIFDEMQHLRNGPQTWSSKGSQRGTACLMVADLATYRVGLTGTPVHNYGGDMFNIMGFLRPELLGDRDEFLREWCGAADGGKTIVRDPNALAEYLMGEGAFTADPGDTNASPPERIEWVIESDRAEFDRIVNNATAMAEAMLNGSSREERFSASGQFEMWMRRATGLAKAPAVATFAEMLLEDETEKLILVGYHRGVYDIWNERLSRYGVAMYTGSESAAQKERSFERFVDGSDRILMMSLASGEGVDGLQRACNVVVFGELDWSPAIPTQIIGRLDRPGQEHQVLAYFLTSDDPDGCDPHMLNTLGVKDRQGAPFNNHGVAVGHLGGGSGPMKDRFLREMAERVLARGGNGRLV